MNDFARTLQWLLLADTRRCLSQKRSIRLFPRGFRALDRPEADCGERPLSGRPIKKLLAQCREFLGPALTLCEELILRIQLQ